MEGKGWGGGGGGCAVDQPGRVAQFQIIFVTRMNSVLSRQMQQGSAWFLSDTTFVVPGP